MHGELHTLLLTGVEWLCNSSCKRKHKKGNNNTFLRTTEI